MVPQPGLEDGQGVHRPSVDWLCRVQLGTGALEVLLEICSEVNPDGSLPQQRCGHIAVWDGFSMYMHGGKQSSPKNDLWQYMPSTNSRVERLE